MRSFAKVCIAVALAGLAGCGAPKKTLPAYMTSSQAEHPKYPRGKYLVQTGMSTISQDDADARAKKLVSEAVSSQLQAETRSFMESSSVNGASTDKAKATEEIVVKTGFTRADLINIAERDRSGDEFYAVAVLDRARCESELGSAVAADLNSYSSYAEAAMKAYAAGRMGEFWTAAAKASEVRPALEASFIIRRAVLTRPAADEGKYTALRDGLAKNVADAFAKQLVIVRVDGAAEADLLKLTNTALQKMKLRVGDQKTCAAIAPEAQMFAAELVLEPEETCGEVQLGEKCEVRVQLRAAACSGGAEGRGGIPAGVAINASERAKAHRAAWQRVLQEQLVETAVREALKGAVTTGCGNSGC
ncbi:MAG: hypothetical protein JST92_17305 [Deltaproteobacteria bacterium]|nr:hypothetical protein [Deltaproteobacteria bacterium]